MVPLRDLSSLRRASTPPTARQTIAARAGLTVMPPTDAARAGQELEWVARIRAGDASAYEALFMAYYEPLVRFAFNHVKERASAEEVVQEVFLRLWAQRAQWEVRDTVRAYLYGAVRNRIFNWLRRHQLERRWTARADASEADEVSRVAQARSADDQVHARELDDAIHRAIAQLPPRRREVFVLSRMHHLSHDQIAAVLGISVKTVHEQIGRALKSLRASLAEWID